jgi:hypothetical protein
MGHDPLRSKQCFGWDHVALWSEGRTRETRERGYDKFKCLAARGPDTSISELNCSNSRIVRQQPLIKTMGSARSLHFRAGHLKRACKSVCLKGRSPFLDIIECLPLVHK